MKKIVVCFICLAVIIIAGTFYLYFGGGDDYTNNHLPTNYKYTQKTELIPDEFAVPRVKKQIGDSLEYFAGEEYDNQYFYQNKGIIYCRDSNKIPEIVTYYSRRPAGYWIFTKMGGYSSRTAFVCGDKYFINDFDSSRGGGIYGPFDFSEEVKQLSTNDWQTYQNEKYGFEFQHPQDWTIQDITKTTSNLLVLGLGIPGLGDSTAWVNVMAENDLTKAIDSHVKNYIDGTKIEKEEPFTLAGAVGKIIYLNVGGNSANLDRWIFVSHDSKTYILGITFDIAPYNKKFDQLLSTFKFTSSWQIYRNEKYGFEIKFPSTWKGYIAKNRTLDWGPAGTDDSVDFGFAIQDSLFNISLHTKNQWQQIQSIEGPKPTYLGENSQYVFGHAEAQDITEGMADRFAEIPAILLTFSIK